MGERGVGGIGGVSTVQFRTFLDKSPSDEKISLNYKIREMASTKRQEAGFVVIKSDRWI
jgi:hypothetical protein